MEVQMKNKLSKIALSDEGFIFDPETGNSYTVNPTGLFILKLLKEGKGQEEIAKALAEEFDVSEKEALRDTADFIEQLRFYGLVEAENV